MRKPSFLALGAVLATAVCLAVASQPLAQAPPFETRKITENVYIFRYVGYQSMFVVTPDGVIATDPIGYLRPQAVTTYIAEIRKVTQAPIKYVRGLQPPPLRSHRGGQALQGPGGDLHRSPERQDPA